MLIPPNASVEVRRSENYVEFIKVTIEREKSVCEQTGVIIILSISGSTTGPPAESEYAVEPVGVETITPAAMYIKKASEKQEFLNLDETVEALVKASHGALDK